MVSNLTPQVWIRIGCDPIINIHDTNPYFVDLPNSDVFWVFDSTNTPSLSLENGVSENILY